MPPRDASAGFVRPARAGDAASLARVQVASWRCGFTGIVPPALLAELTSGEAEEVWRDRWPGTDGEVYELRVSPERTGQGHGSRLLHAVADTLVSDGFHTVSLWALEADTALRRFLESSGWAADGARGELDVGTTVPVVRLHTAISE